MGRKGKKQYSSSTSHVQHRDMYNVKENLRKLRSGNSSERYETSIDLASNKIVDPYYSNNQQDDFSNYSTSSSANRFDRISDKLSSDFSGLKDAFSDHKDLMLSRLNEKVDKSEFKYWIGGIIAGIIAVATLIYTLSYSGIISDTKDLIENKNDVIRKLDKIEFKVEQLEKEKSIEVNKKK